MASEGARASNPGAAAPSQRSGLFRKNKTAFYALVAALRLSQDDLEDAIVDSILEGGRLFVSIAHPFVRSACPATNLAGEIEDSTPRRVSGKIAAEFPEPTSYVSHLAQDRYSSCRMWL